MMLDGPGRGASSGSLGRPSSIARIRRTQAAKIRALRRAEVKNNVKIQLRSASERWRRRARRIALVVTWVVTVAEAAAALWIIVSASLGLEWLGLQVCICKFYCHGDWHEQFTAGPSNWNISFTPDGCDDELWTCQVQGTWSNCMCNEQGTPAVPRSNARGAFMNVNSCQFFRVSGFYLLLDAAFVAIALVQSSAMFKLSQFSPDADRVDLGRVACFFLPDSLRQGCHAKPGESKALFMTFFYVFFWTWVVSVALVAYQVLMENLAVVGTVVEHVFNDQPLPHKFMRYQNILSRANMAVVAMQMVGLWVWLLSNTKFRVVPRLQKIVLRRSGKQKETLYDVDVDVKMRKKNTGGGRSGGSGGGGGGGGGRRDRFLSGIGRGGVLSSLADAKQDFRGRFLRGNRNGNSDGVGSSGGVGDSGGTGGGSGEDGILGGADDGEEVVHGDRLFLNLDMGVTKPDEAPSEFMFIVKIDFVDATGRKTKPPPGLPRPLLSFTVLPDDPSHCEELHAKIKGKQSSRKHSVYVVKVQSDVVLGAHRLDIRQPLATGSMIDAIFNGSDLEEGERLLGRGTSPSSFGGSFDVRGNALEIGRASTSSANAGGGGGGRSGGGGGGGGGSGGSGAFPAAALVSDGDSIADQAMVAASFKAPAEETEEYDAMLARCKYHEILDITISDPAYDHRQLQKVEERLAAVEDKVDELAPELEEIFAKHAQEKALEGDRKVIHETPCLHDYYVLVQMRVVGVSVACNAIASGMVGNEGSAGLKGNVAAGAASMLETLGDHCGLPFVGTATALIGGAARMFAEHEKAKRVRFVQQLFYTPARADEVAERVARAACLRLRGELEEVERADQEATHEAAGGGVGVGKRLKSLLKGARDMMDMAEVAYADTMVKKRAEDDSETLVEAIMSGRFNQTLPRGSLDGLSDDAIVESLLAFIAPQPIEGDEFGGGGEGEGDGSGDSKDDGALDGDANGAGGKKEQPGVVHTSAPYERHPPPMQRSAYSLRTNSSNTEIDNYADAAKFLKKGLEFTKKKWYGLGKNRYQLHLNLEQSQLEWEKVGKKGRRHYLPLDGSLVVLPIDRNVHDAFTVVLQSGSTGGSEAEAAEGAMQFTLVFDKSSLALQFRISLELVLAEQRESAHMEPDHYSGGGGPGASDRGSGGGGGGVGRSSASSPIIEGRATTGFESPEGVGTTSPLLAASSSNKRHAAAPLPNPTRPTANAAAPPPSRHGNGIGGGDGLLPAYPADGDGMVWQGNGMPGSSSSSSSSSTGVGMTVPPSYDSGGASGNNASYIRFRTVHFANGDFYEGSYLDGVGPHGPGGRYVFASGARYDGEYSYAKKHGRGRFQWANGDVYVGQYRDDRRHGHGVHTLCDGTTYHDGLWESGSAVGVN